jgi:murein DD-endopeptidase MepM/ murein hydrolase activator NlpD
MTQSDEGKRTGGVAAGAVDVLDRDPITSIIPLDELEARLEAADGPEWAAATGALDYKPRIAEVTQDLLIPEHLLGDLAPLEPVAEDEVELPAAAPLPVRKGGKHRVPTAPHALKGRAALVALAAGAAVTGTFLAQQGSDAPQTSQQPITPPVTPESNHITVVPSQGSQEMNQFSGALAEGTARKQADDNKIIESMRPKFAFPVPGCQYTSGFGVRWGAMHAGVDCAAPLGTPIYSITNGTVIDAGPASGFGIWIRIQMDDGTILVYGHMYNVNVQKGQKVRAGDLISWVGNNGQSTGPHCHIEVWQGGQTKIDPEPWLAAHGINLGRYVG